MAEEEKYLVIKKLADTNGNKKKAALTLGCTVRHVNRMIKGYKEHGKVFFVHGNRSRKPVHAVDEETKRLVIDLYNTKYYDTNFTHYSELLEKYEGISISPSAVRSILMDEYILSPKARRATKKVAEQLKEIGSTAKSKEEITKINNALVAIGDTFSKSLNRNRKE